MTSIPQFRNEPFADFSRADVRARMERALSDVESRLGAVHPLVIGGALVPTERSFASVDPARPSRIIGHFAEATPEHADRALEAAWEAFGSWRRTPAEERARVLIRAAALMREQKFELAAWMVFEVGKTWVEADGDVAEAIDFLEFYAREGVRWSGPRPQCPWPGEDNWVEYLPLGAGVAIPPWNFPLAIMVGMTMAPVAAGNTMVVKPAEQSPAIAWRAMALFREAGLPGGVVNFLTASDGAVVGRHLVQHPRTRFVSFTGSREVGLEIVREAGIPRPGQRWIKRVVAEMGGKDAILVDSDADVGAAAEGIVAAAFGFQGQKCSACSRVIAVDDVHDALLEEVRRRTEALTVGPPQDPGNRVGPLIDGQAEGKVLSYVEIGRGEGRLVTGGRRLEGEGHFVAPAVFADVAPDARLAQEEIFGPVVAFLRARDYEEAARIFNGTVYGLTGSYYGQRHLDDAARDLEVGNLYLNRKCTGALVGVQPFGGFNMSGTDAKAGGTEHLLQFLQAKAISRRHT